MLYVTKAQVAWFVNVKSVQEISAIEAFSTSLQLSYNHLQKTNSVVIDPQIILFIPKDVSKHVTVFKNSLAFFISGLLSLFVLINKDTHYDLFLSK